MKPEELEKRMSEIRGCLHDGIAKLIELEENLKEELVIHQRTRQNLRHNQEILESQRR